MSAGPNNTAIRRGIKSNKDLRTKRKVAVHKEGEG